MPRLFSAGALPLRLLFAVNDQKYYQTGSGEHHAAKDQNDGGVHGSRGLRHGVLRLRGGLGRFWLVGVFRAANGAKVIATVAVFRLVCQLAALTGVPVGCVIVEPEVAEAMYVGVGELTIHTDVFRIPAVGQFFGKLAATGTGMPVGRIIAEPFRAEGVGGSADIAANIAGAVTIVVVGVVFQLGGSEGFCAAAIVAGIVGNAGVSAGGDSLHHAAAPVMGGNLFKFTNITDTLMIVCIYFL